MKDDKIQSGVKRKNIESSYIKLRRAQSFTNMFLLSLGCDMESLSLSIDKDQKAKQKQQQHKDNLGNLGIVTNLDDYSKELFIDFKNFNGICKVLSSQEEATNTMISIVRIVMQLVEFLVLAFQYCRLFAANESCTSSSSSKIVELGSYAVSSLLYRDSSDGNKISL